MVNQIYLQLNTTKANTTYTEASFLDVHLSIANGFVSSKMYDKRDDFDFDIVNFPFLDGDVSRRSSNCIYTRKFYPSKDLEGVGEQTNKQTNVAQIISTSMTLTFDPIGFINLNQGSTCIHSPSFIQIGPKTAEIQKFDL